MDEKTVEEGEVEEDTVEEDTRGQWRTEEVIKGALTWEGRIDSG